MHAVHSCAQAECCISGQPAVRCALLHRDSLGGPARSAEYVRSSYPEGIAVCRPGLQSGRQCCIVSSGSTPGNAVSRHTLQPGRQFCFTSKTAVCLAQLYRVLASSPAVRAASRPRAESCRHSCIASVYAVRHSVLHRVTTCYPSASAGSCPALLSGRQDCIPSLPSLRQAELNRVRDCTMAVFCLSAFIPADPARSPSPEQSDRQGFTLSLRNLTVDGKIT